MKKEIKKFTRCVTENGLSIPRAAMDISGMDAGTTVECHALDGAVITLKRKMTALELALAAHSLQRMAYDLFNRLCDVCGECDNCAETCPYDDADFEMDLELPESLLKRAGIPGGTKLFATAADGGIVICRADEVLSLQSVPADLMEDLVACNVCPGELEKRIHSGEIVYGGD